MSVIEGGIKTFSNEEKWKMCCLANIPLKYGYKSPQTRKENIAEEDLQLQK